MLESLPLFERI